MQVTSTKTDALNITLTIDIEKADYAELKKKNLNTRRRNADIKGFRKGMAPMSLIEKIYGGQATGDAINTLISGQLDNYIKENKLNILGEPMVSESQPELDWNADTLTFKYDLGIAPEVNLELGADDKITYYNVTVTKEAKAEYKTNLLKQYGSLQDGEASGEEDFIVVDFEQGETKVANAYVALRSVDTEAKGGFIGLKKGDEKEVNVNEAFKNETDRAAMLHVTKEELEGMDPMWKMTVKEVKTFAAAEESQETYDKIYGEGAVKSAEEFDAKVAESLSSEYASESDYRFNLDAQKYLVEKAALELPESFLKRWLKEANEGKFTEEEIEKEFDGFAADFRWQMVRGYMMEKNGLKVTKEDLVKNAKGYAAYQFAMYGMGNVPDDALENYANRLLEDREQGRRIYEKTENDIVMNYIRNTVTLENKNISVAKMREMNQ
ncbi:MAG: hypothetical protein HUJ93_03155 [Bacteroidales bacterium]|nr:hypothetical protein [Bacteroidales bacterium]